MSAPRVRVKAYCACRDRHHIAGPCEIIKLLIDISEMAARCKTVIPRLFGFPCHFPARPSIVAAKYMILLGFTALGEPRKNFSLSFPARQGKIEGTRSIAMVRPSDLKPVALEGGFSLDHDLAPEPVFERAQRVGCVAGQRRCDIRRDRQTPTSPGLRSRFAAQRAQRLVRDGDRGLNERAARATARGAPRRADARAEAAPVRGGPA